MKKKILISAITFLACVLCAQQKTTSTSSKGVKEITPSPLSREGRGEVYAVVVGISDYQDPGIPDLRFADKDAEAFANYLRSTAGGPEGSGLDNDHLKVLINQQATMAQFGIALDWIMENAKEGDKAIIYFSGHGDVEKKTITQPGFLLCWDAPARVYISGGAFALPMLQEVISTLSIQNKAKVIVITDACRSGTLAGSSVGGSQATASNLARQYANEIKIMSCQPNEFSIEGEQWGGGRGAFSYNLVNGMFGLADQNNDLGISLQEIGRYLEDHVTSEVAPVSQVPMILGNRMERIANVNPVLLASLKAGRDHVVKSISTIDSRGIEEDVLRKLDTSIRKVYKLFQQSLKDKLFLKPVDACAEKYYSILSKEPGLEKLHSTLRRNYAAALQDEAQQMMNILLKSGLTPELLKGREPEKLYKDYPDFLERASVLLGKEHYMYPVLQARKYFFMGRIKKDEEQKRDCFFSALKWQSDLPHAYLGLIQCRPSSQLDSALYYTAKSLELLPAWIQPNISLAKFYEEKMKNYAKADSCYDEAMKLDTNSLVVWYQRSGFYKRIRNYEKAELWLKKTVSKLKGDICFPCAHNELARLYESQGKIKDAEKEFLLAYQLDSTAEPVLNNLGNLYNNTGQFDKARTVLRMAITLDSTVAMVYGNLGITYYNLNNKDSTEYCFKKAVDLEPHSYSNLSNLGAYYNFIAKYELAEEVIKRAIQLDTNSINGYINLANTYLSTDRLEEAEKLLMKSGRMDPGNYYVPLNLAVIYGLRNQLDEAFEYLEKSMILERGSFEELSDLPGLENLRLKTDRWNTLMKKYFPEKIKN
jgi:tetratricopeptide (TPR) repeat protein/uncharacterized caspase-like protein